MILEKIGTSRWYRYELGDEITLQRTGDADRFTATITSICDTGFIVNMETFIKLTDVKSVWRKYPSRKKNGTRLIIAGGVLVTITAINNLANGRTVIDPVFLVIGAGISAGGLLWRSLSMPRYKVGTRWKLKVFDQEFL